MGNGLLSDDLAGISLRHLEVFSTVIREGSYANAAIDLQMSRTNVKRICGDFEGIVGRALVEEASEGRLVASGFGRVLFGQLGPLSTSLRKMEESVRQFHRAGRVLRFGAAGGFFRGGLFTEYLTRLDLSGKFRSCFLMVDPEGAQKSLLAAECDVYFGIGLGEAVRLDRIELGSVGWNVAGAAAGKGPKSPKDLKKGWFMVIEGEASVCGELLEKFHEAGASGGELITREAAAVMKGAGLVLSADMANPLGSTARAGWPCHKFCALMRRHHPYEDLKTMLCAGAGKEGA